MKASTTDWWALSFAGSRGKTCGGGGVPEGGVGGGAEEAERGLVCS